ncbi:uncharacterized protein FA14DRAFT_181941 [Meira miltonrushii]|uniref:GATA-type domain-containing protein n=1 Tax=Meira miltonrushii TaxID=1280837 RepID=A0A316V3J4_9BASI|nr:uncharacterized protein FA14DRAFT_181941 [Meira miltonrushii]PWN32022.1 hypothetical protein FA14DRAFT_181941 [Meira miltonrushii]
MGSRKPEWKRQRSASMFDNSQLANVQSTQQGNEIFDSNFPLSQTSINALFSTDTGFNTFPSTSAQYTSFVQPMQNYMQQQSNSQQQQQQAQPQIAKPYHSIISPFPLELDKRYTNQEKIDILGKRKGKQKNPSENVQCFWALLSIRPKDFSNFAFLHLDPTLEESLGRSFEQLIGTSVLDMIHPNDANMIRFNILQYASEKGNKGKMVRCTMKSARSMGKYVSSSSQDEVRMESYSFDQLTDVRMELIGDEMILCFFHAVEDRSRRGDDRLANLCETSLDSFNDQWCQSLWQHVFSKRMVEQSMVERLHNGHPIKVFQILSNVSKPSMLFSWPPPRLFDSMIDESNKSDTETYRDGSYFADVFARSAFETDFREEDIGLSQHMNACNKRHLKATTITADGLRIEFEILVIPRGDIRFAVFSIFKAEYVTEEVAQSAFRQPQQPSFATTTSDQNQQSPAQSFYPQLQLNQTLPTTIPSFQSMPAASNPYFVQMSQMFYNMPSARMIDNADLSEYGRRSSLQVDPITSQPSASMANNTFLQSNQSRDEQSQHVDLSGYRGRRQDIMPSSHPVQRPRHQSISYFESPGKKCLTCGTSKSPEWRKGPDGNKSLCNACGLRFSRNASRVKKKEEKARNAAEVAANGGVIPVHLRRKFEAERDRKKISIQKPSQSTSQQQTQSQSQQPTQMDLAGLSAFANISPELDIQIPSSMLASSSRLDSGLTESTSSIEDFMTDYEMDIKDEFGSSS